MPGPFDPSLRVKPPRCTDPHPKTAQGRRQCPTCTTWDRYIKAQRRDDLKAGRRRIGERPITTVVVKAHRCPLHRHHRVAGCTSCQAWARYLAAERRLAKATGTLERCVDPKIVTDHLRALTDPNTGGWHLREIAEVSGISKGTVTTLAGGRRTGSVFPSTWNALRVLQPKGTGRGRRADLVDATEARRIMQGLNRQGFTMVYLGALLGRSKKSAQRIAHGESDWIKADHLEEIRALGEKLKDQDIALTGPMPGMRQQAATSAERFGWVPLSAWTPANIGNPAAQPYTFAQQDPDDLGYPSTQQISYADPLIHHRVLLVAQKLDEIDNVHARAAAHIDPIGRVTRLEAYVLTATAVDAGMSSSEIALLLGYPPAQREVGERQVSRFRATLKIVRKWLDSDPQCTAPPDWFRTARLTSGRRDMAKLLPALLAVQVPPYGPGWTVAELAARCRVPEADMHEFLVWASTQEGDRLWHRQPARTGRRRTGRTAKPCVSRQTARAA